MRFMLMSNIMAKRLGRCLGKIYLFLREQISIYKLGIMDYLEFFAYAIQNTFEAVRTK